jgi:hypothetical protein
MSIKEKGMGEICKHDADLTAIKGEKKTRIGKENSDHSDHL